MVKSKSKMLLIACVVFGGGLGGCANHIRVDSEVETDVDRKKVSQIVDIETDAGSLVTTPLIHVQVQDSESFDITTYESKTDYDVSTPYQGVRELYEFPAGLLLLPVAIVVNVLDFVTLGLIPNSATDNLLDWSFTGMNPFLNFESEKRSERTLTKTDKKKIDEKEEFLKKPLAGHVMQVSSNGARIDVTLDEIGKAEFSLIRLSALTSNIEKITLDVNVDSKDTQKDIDVSRQLRSQLEQASVITKKYAAVVEKEPMADVFNSMDMTVFATDLVSLSKLGFESESLRIEKKAQSLMTEEQKLAFKGELDKALKL